MTDEDQNIVSSSQISALQQFMENGNLPQLIAGPAGKAISQLVAGVVAIPLALLKDLEQGIRDKTKAKTIVSDAIAKEVALKASNDPEVIERALSSLVAKLYRGQINREEIAKKTIDNLNANNFSNIEQCQSASVYGPPNTTGQNVDEDWLNMFAKYAEDASTEKMQDLWARVLAGEIRNPSRFSLRTLGFLSEFDSTIASLFEKYVPMVCSDDSNSFIPIGEETINNNILKYENLSNLLNLQDCGLLRGIEGFVSIVHKPPNIGVIPIGNHYSTYIICQGIKIIVEIELNQTFSVRAIHLTQIAKDLISILHLPFDRRNFDLVVERLPKGGVSIMKTDGDKSEILWQKPPSAP